ncbi:MAG: AMP-binding protein, partial [Actinomycetota bacterium]
MSHETGAGDGPVPPTGAGAPRGTGSRTIAELWRTVDRRAAQPPFLEERETGWTAVPWPEAARRVDDLAAGFLAHGVRRGDAVAIAGRTRLEWVLVDLALLTVGAVVVPVYPGASVAESAHVLAHSGAGTVVCEDAAQRAAVARIAAERGAAPRVVAIDDAGEGDLSLARLEEDGRR